jgi:hypothetical protein
MRPRVYKLNHQDLADEIKVNLAFIPLEHSFTDMGLGGQYGRDLYVDVASLIDSVILRFTEFAVRKDESGRPVSSDFAGTYYQKLDNVVLTQDNETGDLKLVSSKLEDIAGSFEEISIPNDRKPEDAEENIDEDDDEELEAEEAVEEEKEEETISFKDAVDEAMNSDEDIHTMEAPEFEAEEDDSEEEPADDEDESEDEQEEEPESEEIEEEDDDEDINVFSEAYFEETKEAEKKTEENRKELAQQISEQQSKLVSANKRQLPKPQQRLVPNNNIANNNNRNQKPNNNGKKNKKFQNNRDNRDVKIVKAPGIFDDPLRAELFNKLRED